MLRASNAAMLGAGIIAGDLVLLDRSRNPKDGDIVLAEVDERTALRYFRKRGSHVYLEAAHPHYQSIVPREKLTVTMDSQPLMLGSYPHAILHIDGDAFFASCEQAGNPKLKGKPVVTGKERGIAASMSYEAKARGVTRGMRISDITKVCPDVVLLPSDYETYSLLATRFYAIVRRFTSDVEEYSIDECFADITGYRRVYRASYTQIAERIKQTLDRELGCTFSVGLAPNKVLAKVGSKWKKPSGLTAIPGRDIHLYLAQLPVEKLWGIGPNTTAFLAKHRIHTALEYARASEQWVRANLTKPFYQIWQELHGQYVMQLDTTQKDSYASIQKMKTFTPASLDPAFLFAQLSKNIENACNVLQRITGVICC